MSRVPKVLLLTSMPLDGIPGADTRMATDLARRIRGVRYSWFGSVGGSGRVELDGHHRVPLAVPRGLPGPLARVQVATAATVLQRRVDLVHAVLTVGPRFARYSRARQALPTGWRPPVIHTVPGFVDSSLVPVRTSLGTTVALSSATAERLRAMGVTDVRVIPPGVDLQRWAWSPLPEGDPPTLLFSGHADPSAGVRETLLTAAELRKRNVPARLVMALRPRRGQDLHRVAAGITAEARALSVDVVVHGVVPDFAALVREASVILFPAVTLHGKADIPLVLLEALAAGRPVVASDLPTFEALGDAAVRVPVGDPRAAADAVAELLDDRGAMQDRARHGRAHVEARFDAADVARRYEDLYAEILGASRSSSSSSSPTASPAAE